MEGVADRGRPLRAYALGKIGESRKARRLPVLDASKVKRGIVIGLRNEPGGPAP